jgi:hypothetical protein
MPREAKWGQVPIGSAHADDLFCNVEHLLDLALASVVERVEFDDLTGLSNTLNLELENPPRSVQLLGETIKAARVLWSTRNFDAAIGGFATALSKLYEMKDDRGADLVEARMYRQMVSRCTTLWTRLFLLSMHTCFAGHVKLGVAHSGNSPAS